MSKDTRKIRANELIRVPQIRLIGAQGEQLGIVPVKEGLRRAQEEGLDLVEVAPNVKPPVCRVMDLGKYLYTLSKKDKESRKKQKIMDVKEVKMTPKIEEHDYQTKLRNSRGFIERGDKVKLTMFFRGREITHPELGTRIVERFREDLSDIAELERNEGLEGNAYHLYFTPLSGVKKTTAAGGPEGAAESPATGPETTGSESAGPAPTGPAPAGPGPIKS